MEDIMAIPHTLETLVTPLIQKYWYLKPEVYNGSEVRMRPLRAPGLAPTTQRWDQHAHFSHRHSNTKCGRAAIKTREASPPYARAVSPHLSARLDQRA